MQNESNQNIKSGLEPSLETSPEPHAVRLSAQFKTIASVCQNSSLTVGHLIEALHEKGQMLVCLVFAAPFLLPIPLPGLSTIFGAVTLLAGFQVLFDRDLWIPKSWMDRKIPAEYAQKIFLKLSDWMARVEHLIKPRMISFSRSYVTARLKGLSLIILSVLLALPMPPGFNTPPALAICILTIGSIEDDGYLVAFAWVLTVFNIVLFAAFFILGWEGLMALLTIQSK
ncbi:MAG: exopolysaccharide biosynthesis protein [Proteobacteria bacterium]|nr:exopolysaccharide biosynthesis protein [Pseudomonadota bacterium]